MSPTNKCVAALSLAAFVLSVAPVTAQDTNVGASSTTAFPTSAETRKSCEAAAARWKEKDKFMTWCEAEGGVVPLTQTKAASGEGLSSQPQPVYPNGPPPGVEP
jgi:hypothetical protein